MKKLIQNLILVIILSMIILFSYAFLQNKIDSFDFHEIYDFLMNKSAGENQSGETDLSSSDKEYRAVWLSYLEFNAYRKSVNKNDEESFRKFYKRVLDRSKACGINRVIVQVRPFSDALYPSEYFPWAACISGTQGKSPGYDPLKIMVEMTHNRQMYIEAWINPYRISTGNSIKDLSTDNPAKKWAASTKNARNVLSYEEALYYNPSSSSVRKLICDGIEEIISKYDVDGIHMDDYFYPVFTEKNVESVFDAPEYKKQKEYSSSSDSIAEWRRNNVNMLVSDIYNTIKQKNKSVSFGISPAGNLSNLRSNLEYYVDIDTWVKDEGYVDYVMPQIYWGYTNTQAPFDKTLKEWEQLTKGTGVKLYVGLQLYRMGTTDQTQLDYAELQKANLITKQIKEIEKSKTAEGYCIFSYQYLDVDNKTYQFDTNEFSAKRKRVLKKIGKDLAK